MAALNVVSATAEPSPYSLVGEKLCDAGYPAIPAKPGEKIPGSLSFGQWYGVNDWTRFCDRAPTEIEIGIWNGWPDAGVCVALGLNGLVAVDIDTDDPEIMAAILNTIPPSPVGKKGAKGKTLFYRGNVQRIDSETGEVTGAIASRGFNTTDGRVLDLLAHGKQTVLPPSIHPNGMPYEWITSDTLVDTPLNQLPVLPDDIAERIVKAIEPFGYTEPVGHSMSQVADSDGYWRGLKDLAFANLDAWVPALGLPKTKRHGKGYRAVATWRLVVNSNAHGKALSIHPDGIKDWGDNDKTYSPIDLVAAARSCDPHEATEWLAEKLGYKQNPEHAGVAETFVANVEARKALAAQVAANDNVASVDVKPVNARPSVQDDSISAEALMGMEFAPLQYIVPGYITEGLFVLGGKPKLGKSWLAYDMGVAIATGGKFAGTVDCEQGDVLYLALEDNRRRVQSRLETVCPTRKLLGVNLDRLTIRTVAPRIDTGLLPELDKWRASCERPRLIIIDVYMKGRPPRKKGEDPYAADYAAGAPLQQYTSDHRLAIVLVTHTRKMEAEDPIEAISGTNGVTGVADGILVLARNAKGTTLYGRGRDIEEIKTAMLFDAGRWQALGNAEDIQKSGERQKIIAVLREAGEEVGPKYVAEQTGMKAANVRKLLEKMVKDGEALRPRLGFYTVPYRKPES